MITCYVVVNRHNQMHGALTLAPPSSIYMEAINSAEVGGYIKRDQPFRVVKLVEDQDYTFSEGT